MKRAETPEPAPGAAEISIVTFARNEERNLPVLYEQVLAAMQNLQASWELIIVDDHSDDGTFGCAAQMAGRDPRVRGIRLSRNFGSHAARLCGLHWARGRCAITLAADLQDPPAVIPQMIARWREGAQLVAGIRASRPGESTDVRGFSWLYRNMLRQILDVSKDSPDVTGYCLLDRKVIEASRLFPETNSNSLALLQWMGFRTSQVEYDQQVRVHGRSNWTFRRKLRLVMDSITGFGSAPVRLMMYAGLVVFVLGIAVALFAVRLGNTAQGFSPWAIVLAAVLVLGGAQMSMTGLLGEYLWRTLADARRRPQYLIEDTVGFPARSSAAGGLIDQIESGVGQATQ